MKETALRRTKLIALIALFAALAAVGAFVKIPIGTVPVTLQFAFCNLAMLLLGWKWGTVSIAVYLVLGLVGVPIFTLGGGLGYVLQPTFGYLLGFCLGCFFGGLICSRGVNGFARRLCGSLVNLVIVYTVGVLYLGLIRLGARLRRGQTPRPRRWLHSPHSFGRHVDREGIAQVEACPPAAIVRRGAPFAMRSASEEMSNGAKRRLVKCAFNGHGHRKITCAEQGRRLLDARRHCSEREVQRLRPRPCRRGALWRNLRRHRRRPRGRQGRLAPRHAPPHCDLALCAAACSYRSARDLRPRLLALRRGRCRLRRRERENLNFSLKTTGFCPHLILFAQKA